MNHEGAIRFPTGAKDPTHEGVSWQGFSRALSKPIYEIASRQCVAAGEH
jgi:hypothetical protein